MRLVRIKRNTKTETRYTTGMGSLQTRVTYIQKSIAGIRFRTVHKYRETYYGRVKSCEDCVLAN